MSIPTFGAPAATNEDGDNYVVREHVGATLIIKPRSFNPSVVTANSPNGTPSVRVDLVDLDDRTGQYVFRNVPFFGGALVDATRPAVDSGEVLLARVTMVNGKSGRDYPVLTPANTDQQAVQRATQFYQQAGDPFAQQFAAPAEPSAPPAPQQNGYGQPQQQPQNYGQAPQQGYGQQQLTTPPPAQPQYAAQQPAPQYAPAPQQNPYMGAPGNPGEPRPPY